MSAFYRNRAPQDEYSTESQKKETVPESLKLVYLIGFGIPIMFLYILMMVILWDRRTDLQYDFPTAGDLGIWSAFIFILWIIGMLSLPRRAIPSTIFTFLLFWIVSVIWIYTFSYISQKQAVFWGLLAFLLSLVHAGNIARFTQSLVLFSICHLLVFFSFYGCQTSLLFIHILNETH